ncbi:REP element-mobilizing transposase RayT [Streptomyces sp. V3I7]|nr:transposase [Streptomyces sp. V3I7]MDQ0993591.1 REP element-mobilizing transposase RayT [Streptomyces sp. V3I7]
MNFPPEVTVTKLVNSLKGVSSRRLRQEFTDLARWLRRDQLSRRSAPQAKNCSVRLRRVRDAPRRHHQIRFTTGLKADALRNEFR